MVNMDKGLRNNIAKLKQKQRLKTHKDITWMTESQIGDLKNRDNYHRNDSKLSKEKYKRNKKYRPSLDDE